MTGSTVTQDGFVYEYDAYGFVVSCEKEPEPALAPFWWEVHPVNADAAHEATQAMGRGQR
jgi:hypothetical protein